MMDDKAQLRLQAYLDGELAQGERHEVEAWLARDAEAVALLTELRQTTAALRGFESEIKLPESGEFYWSKIQREIQRQARPTPAPASPSLVALWRRFLAPMSAMAAVVVAGLLAVLQLGRPASPESEMALSDTAAFTYRDYARGMTLVWVSYPADREPSTVNWDELFY